MKSKKSILFLLNRDCSFLPPFLAILDALCDSFDLKVISQETEQELARLKELYNGKSVEFLCPQPLDHNKSLKERAIGKAKRLLGIRSQFTKMAAKLIETTPHDLLWVIHERTLAEFGEVLKGRKFVVSLYELNDQDPVLREKITPLLQEAMEVMIPEFNRACILRVWSKLSKTPTVVPNKPFSHPRQKNIPNQFTHLLENKRIVLYQGYIQRSRNLDKICEACETLDDYMVVLLGKGDKEYIASLKERYPGMLHLPFILPPEHLYVTSWARIAVVKYDFVTLNGIFCAPNKIWEYTGFGIPVLGNLIPGLEYTIGLNKAGLCCDLDDASQIKKAIKAIEADYTEYSTCATAFYNSLDIQKLLREIALRNS